MSPIDTLGMRIEAAAQRILGYAPEQWQMKAEAYAICFSISATVAHSQLVFKQYEQDCKSDIAFTVNTQWGRTTVTGRMLDYSGVTFDA